MHVTMRSLANALVRLFGTLGMLILCVVLLYIVPRPGNNRVPRVTETNAASVVQAGYGVHALSTVIPTDIDTSFMDKDGYVPLLGQTVVCTKIPALCDFYSVPSNGHIVFPNLGVHMLKNAGAEVTFTRVVTVVKYTEHGEAGVPVGYVTSYALGTSTTAALTGVN